MSTRKCKHLSAMASPSVGEAGKTGQWRTVRPVVDQSKCSAAKGANCYLCSDFCPEGVIPRIAPIEVDLEYCKGCGICCEECPTGAIAMMPEHVGAEYVGAENTTAGDAHSRAD
jgi:pyruvate ferredoxin oxidoreductase delta subunit